MEGLGMQLSNRCWNPINNFRIAILDNILDLKTAVGQISAKLRVDPEFPTLK